MLIFHKVIHEEIEGWDYKTILGISFAGPILSVILIVLGIGYLLIMIPYKLLFRKGEKNDN